MNNATARRIAGIRSVNDRAVTTTPGVGNTFNADRATIAEWIRELSKLGRTERWTNAVEQWAMMVEDTDSPLEWAFLQFGVYAAHNVD